MMRRARRWRRCSRAESKRIVDQADGVRRRWFGWTLRRWTATGVIAVALVPLSAWMVNAISVQKGATEVVSTPSWPASVPEDWSRVPSGHVRNSTWNRDTETAVGPGPLGPRHLLSLTRVRVGVPFRSLEGVDRWENKRPPLPPESQRVGGSIWERGLYVGDEDPWRTASYHRMVPLRPLPLGFAGNTLVSFVLICGLQALVQWGRAASRRRRGLCECCGYPRSSSPREVCSECGARGRPAR
jgi:hypothetical protein